MPSILSAGRYEPAPENDPAWPRPGRETAASSWPRRACSLTAPQQHGLSETPTDYELGGVDPAWLVVPRAFS
jgi:hypothetical protein